MRGVVRLLQGRWRRWLVDVGVGVGVGAGAVVVPDGLDVAVVALEARRVAAVVVVVVEVEARVAAARAVRVRVAAVGGERGCAGLLDDDDAAAVPTTDTIDLVSVGVDVVAIALDGNGVIGHNLDGYFD